MTLRTITDEDSDSQSDDDVKYKKLLKSVGVDLDEKADLEKQERTEASQDVSVFSLSTTLDDSSDSKSRLNELLKGIKETANVNALKQKIKRVQLRDRNLDAPLSKPAAERLHRKVEYEKTTKDLKKWDAVVQKNRRAESLSFPLNQQPLKVAPIDEHLASTRTDNMTPLEREIYAIVNGNKFAERPDHDLSVAEETALASMSLEEAQERRAELQKHRALMSYHESKNKRQNKIKSRKYHRMLRKKKQKEEKDLETEPDSEIRVERLRAEERASLRHRMGSKWARNRALMAKHDANTKVELQDQLNKHRELTQKLPEVLEDDKIEAQSSDDDDNDDKNYINFAGNELLNAADNPWLRSVPAVETYPEDQEIQITSDKDVSNKSEDIELESIPSDTEIISVQNRERLRSWLAEKNTSPEPNVSFEFNYLEKDAKDKFQKACLQLAAESRTEVEQEKVGIKHEREDDEEQDGDGLVETFQENNINSIEQVISKTRKLVEDSNAVAQKPVKIDIKKSFSVSETNLSKNEADFVENDENDDDLKMTIQQAFADDDVIAEFTATKRKLIDDSAPKEINLTLPGWGNWGGAGVAPQRKRKRFTNKPPPQKPRRDNNLGHVIINEKRDVHMAKHQVSQLPFMFTDAEQFERTIATPIGDTWNTPSTVKELTKPKVSTQIGAIIEPMNKSEAFESVTEKNKPKSKLKFIEGKKTTKAKRRQQRNQNLLKLLN